MDNPIAAYLQAQQLRNQNQQQMYQDIAGIGQGFNTIGQAIDEQRKKKIVDQLMQAMQNQNQSIRGPSGYVPPGSGPNAVPAGQKPDMSGQISSLMMQYDPASTMKSLIPENALQRSQVDLNKARAAHLQQPSQSAQLTTVYRNPQTGDVSDQPQAGWTPFQVKPGQALQTLTNIPLSKERADAQKNRTEAWNRSIDTKQIDSLAKATGLHPTVVRQLQTNNLRADRALSILNDPKATWSALNGWVSTDFAGIMQGGAPQKEQILESQFPNWRAKVSQIRTYVGNEPKGSIPDGFREYMRHFVQGVKDIDNDYLKKNADFQQSIIGPTIRGSDPFVKKSQDYMKSFIEGPTSNGGLTPAEQKELAALEKKFGGKP